MSELADLLAERLEAEPRRPSEPDLGGDISAIAYWSFDPSLEIVVAEAAGRPADGAARNARGSKD